MKLHLPSNIQYSKSADDVTERTIIPTSIPTKVVAAIDASDLTDAEIEVVCDEYVRYDNYRKRHMSMLFNFNDWIEHTNSSVDVATLKYRSFSPTKIEEL